MPEPGTTTLVNRYLGPYQLTKRLNQGGTADIYLAQSPSGERNRTYVAKVLKRELATDRLCTAGIRSEYDTLAELDLPGIPRALRFGEVEGRPGFVMQRIDGADVYRLVKDATPIPRVETMLRMVTLAARLHREQIIHNDLKPENFILSSQDNQLHLIDFGNAKRPVKRGITTMFFVRRLKRVRGTPAYMAPELLKRKHPTFKSDIYALGSCAHFLLTNRPLRSRQEATGSIRKDAAAAVARFDIPELPREMNQVLSHCVHPDPDLRPDDADNLLVLLQRHLPGDRDRRTLDERLVLGVREEQTDRVER